MTTSIAFLVLLAVANSIAVEIIGVLLILEPRVTPAATAVHLTKRALWGFIVSILVAVTATGGEGVRPTRARWPVPCAPCGPRKP